MNSGPLQEQRMLLSVKPFLQPPDLILHQSSGNGAAGHPFLLLIKHAMIPFPFGIQLLFTRLLTCCSITLFTELTAEWLSLLGLLFPLINMSRSQCTHLWKEALWGYCRWHGGEIPSQLFASRGLIGKLGPDHMWKHVWWSHPLLSYLYTACFGPMY